jgi:hypothetical protein
VLAVDPKALGMAEGCSIANAESGEVLVLQDGKLALPLKKHELRVLRILPRAAK